MFPTSDKDVFWCDHCVEHVKRENIKAHVQTDKHATRVQWCPYIDMNRKPIEFNSWDEMEEYLKNEKK